MNGDRQSRQPEEMMHAATKLRLAAAKKGELVEMIIPLAGDAVTRADTR